MSKHIPDAADHGTGSETAHRYDSVRSSFDIRGPIEQAEDHEHNDHYALIYEDQRRQFDTVVPFVRDGLQRGERCIYVADDNTVDEVVDAMRARGVDVDRALESGALSVHTEAETYRRNGEFDCESMLEFWEDALSEAKADEFTGVRAAAEMTWALEADDTGLDRLCEYEELLNPLYDGEDYSVLCQYSRDRFPPDVLQDVLKTHPFIVYDETTVCQNFYYTPPAEYFGPERESRELDRKLATLVDRADARETIETRERYQRDLYETIADPKASFAEKIEDLLELGRNRLDLEIGYFTERSCADIFEIVEAVGTHDRIRPGVTESLEGSYSERLLEGAGQISVRNARTGGTDADADTDADTDAGAGADAVDRFGHAAYFGTTVHVSGEPHGTLCFASETPREDEFSAAERTFLDLMSQWVSYELEREQRAQALEASNERLEQFAYAASHDLQEPLRMVSSYLQLVERRYGDELDGEIEEFIAFAVDGADRMREMIDGLLEYSRVETRGDPFEPVDLEPVVDDVLADLQFQIEERRAEITTGDLPRVTGDASQLRQVFQNLVENAIQYSGDDRPRVHVDAERRGRDVVVSVRDEGIGIDRDDQDRVFTVFDRLHSRDEYEGTGIGLALCQRIVERHGGDIWVDSKPGDGSTFCFTLSAMAE